ncbi:MAG: bifunctional hydroxymethylpyrimidine kinase/phosphomethylpyrimidine kinase [Acidimicrobiales bacterium]
MTDGVATPPVVLTIGGADSGGCYGVPTDLRTFAALGVHGTSALTVVTAQNTLGLRNAQPIPIDLIAAQLDAVLDDFRVAAVKTGMLGRAEVVDLVARYAAGGRLPNLVVDPVVVDRHGTALFGDEVIERYRNGLFPHAALVTPNTAELAVLAAEQRAGEPDAVTALAGGRPVVVTAGRLGGAEACDLLWDGDVLHRIVAGRVVTANNAGSGDAFSAAVAAQLALGAGLLHAVHAAKAFVHRALAGAASWRLGQGPGPLDLRPEGPTAR